MVFTKKESYVKQVVIYFTNKDYINAFSLSNEFVAQFPDTVLSHFFLAKSAFWVKNYSVAIDSARKAFNMSSGKDLLTTGLLLSSAYYMAEEFQKGYTVLKNIETALPNTDLNHEFEELMTIYSLALNNYDSASKYIQQLYDINKGYAESFILNFLS